MEEKKETFRYTYSAERQEEIDRIRQKYVPRQEDQMDRLRRLDASATRPGAVASIALGIFGTLLFGLGMTCCLVWTERWMIPGIAIGVLGMLGVAAAYPLYKAITKRQREKLAPEIIRLTDELSGT